METWVLIGKTLPHARFHGEGKLLSTTDASGEFRSSKPPSSGASGATLITFTGKASERQVGQVGQMAEIS